MQKYSTVESFWLKKKRGGEEEVAWNKQNFKLMGISFII